MVTNGTIRGSNENAHDGPNATFPGRQRQGIAGVSFIIGDDRRLIREDERRQHAQQRTALVWRQLIWAPNVVCE